MAIVTDDKTRMTAIGPESLGDRRFVMSPSEVVAASEPRNASMSEGAAHFELANHLWLAGDRDAAIEHFNVFHRLQPDN